MATRRVSPREPALGMLVKIWPKLSETFILEEVLALERQGVALRLYALAEPTDELSHAEVAQVRAAVTYVPRLVAGRWREFAAHHARAVAAAPFAYFVALGFAARRGRRGLADFARAGWLAAQLARDGVAHLHTHFISGPADVSELVARVSGLPFSISAHAKDIYLSAPADLRRKLRAARFTVTCTEFNRSTLAAIAPEADIHRMYHGVNPASFHPRNRLAPSPVPLILAVGRLREKKGLDSLIEACRLLRDAGEAFRCEIVGYGEERERLAAHIARCGIADRVSLTGKLARDEVVERYARAAVFVQPSRIGADGDRDGIPNVLLEAMAAGVPVVATRVSGIPELVRHGRNGLLVEADAPAQLADAVQRLLRQPGLAAELTEAARATVVESFDNDRNLRLLMQLLEARHDRHAQCAVA